MSEPLPDTWNHRDLPVLRVVVSRYDDDGDHVHVGTVINDTGLSADDVQRAARALSDAGFVDTWTRADGSTLMFKSASAQARQLAGSWPTPENAADRLIASLEKQLDEAPDEEQRGKIRAALDAFKDVSRQILVKVGTDIATGHIPT